MILVLGATGFLGKRVCRLLQTNGARFERSSLSLGCDLRDPSSTLREFDRVKPRFVLNCAAFVGGIQFGYKHPAELFHNNLLMSLNILEACRLRSVERLVNPISNCAYPAKATLFRESEFWDGPLHESVLSYGFARKASLVGGWAYAKQYGVSSINLILSNMYGPEDHFEPERSHALGALVMKIVTAKREGRPYVDVWGTGTPVREWLHVDDGARAMLLGMSALNTTEPINIGVGKGCSVIELAKLISRFADYSGELRLDPSKPDGAAFKTVDGSRGRLALGWTPTVDFEDGVRDTVKWYESQF